MARIQLKKLLTKDSSLSSSVIKLLQVMGPGLSIYDVDGTYLLGVPSEHAAEKLPVLVNNEILGWIMGDNHSDNFVPLLEYILQQEEEKKSLADEVLDNYRELHLLLNLSEKLTASMHMEDIAQMAFQEAGTLIHMSGGIILLEGENEAAVGSKFTCGKYYQLKSNASVPENAIQRVLRSGQAELVNDVSAGLFFESAQETTASLLCAPLKNEQRILGVIILVGDMNTQYTARDLKLLYSVAAQTTPAIEISRLYEKAIQKARITQELQMAHEVQVSLLPKEVPQVPGWEFAARWCPSGEVAGDFFDIIVEPDGHIGLVIADVADKGLPASLFMASTRSILRATMTPGSSPVQRIFNANQIIYLDSSYNPFVTLIYAQLDPKTGELIYVNAGHNPPMFYRAEQNQISELTRTGLPLGVQQDSEYTQGSVWLKPGDFIFFYTDGLTEAIDADEQPFGSDRVKKEILDHSKDGAEDLVDTLEEAVDVFEISPQHYDDITMMVVKRL